MAAGDQDEDNAVDLFSASNINRKTIGAKQFRGPDPGAPAYRFVRFDYIPPVGAAALGRIARAMRAREGFFLTATLKQDRKTRGTLLALEGPGASHRQFEIVSNGPADTLDLTYWLDGTQHVLSLEDVGLADSQWKNVTVQVTAETFSLYVGCDLIDSFALDEPFYEQLKTEKSRMYVAKGSARDSHFRVRAAGPCGARRGGPRRPDRGCAPVRWPCQRRPGTHTLTRVAHAGTPAHTTQPHIRTSHVVCVDTHAGTPHSHARSHDARQCTLRLTHSQTHTRAHTNTIPCTRVFTHRHPLPTTTRLHTHTHATRHTVPHQERAERAVTGVLSHLHKRPSVSGRTADVMVPASATHVSSHHRPIPLWGPAPTLPFTADLGGAAPSSPERRSFLEEGL